MKISACYIVKNEENVIQRSIDSLMDAVDEIILVDTGSTDQTIEVAKKYPKVNIYSYTWQNDFAAARNVAIEKAAGDWIIFLDADEFFAPETVKNIRAIIEKALLPEVLLVRMKNIELTTGEVLSEFWAPRIFRREAFLRYKGKIHEQLCRADGSVPAVKLISAAALFLLHTGYSAAQSREKAQRNLAMLQEAMQHTEHPEDLYMYMAEAYYGLGDMIQAEHYAHMDIAGGRRSITYASRSYRLLLQLLAEKKAYVERKEIAVKAAEAFPEMPEFHAELAECLAYEFSYTQAIAAMERALTMIPAVDSLEISQFDDDCRQMGTQRLKLWKDILLEMRSVRLSACIIAKNEAKDVRKWIKNARQYADEIIFVDTGSEDQTVALAEQEGVPVYKYEWQDDFSSARNYALSQATGDWIAFLDADEVFNDTEKVRPFLATVIKENLGINAIMVPIANVDEDFGNREFHRFLAVRLFRNLPEIQYVGRVHEQIAKRNGCLEIFKEEYGRICVQHTGYSSQRIEKKVKRNLALLLQDIQAQGEKPQHYRYLADCYMGLKDYEKSLYYAKRAIAAPVHAMGSDSDMFFTVIESMRQLHCPAEEMLQFLKQAIQRYPALPDFYAEKGIVLSSQKKLEEAKQYFAKALELWEGSVGGQGEASRFQGALASVYCRLGEIHQLQRDPTAAEAAFQKAFAANPYLSKTLSAYRLLHTDDTAKEFIQRLQKLTIYECSPKDQEFLRHWAEKSGHSDIFLQYVQNDSIQSVSRFYVLAQKKDLSGLYAAVINEAAVSMQRLFIAALKLMDSNTGSLILKRAVSMFPKAVVEVLQRYGGAKLELQPEAADAYFAVLPAVLRSADDDMLQRFVMLSLDFNWKEVIHTAQLLLEKEKWQIAMSLYEKVPEEAVNADFWYHVGICAYYLRNFPLAAECLKNAQLRGCIRPGLADYQQLCDEVL